MKTVLILENTDTIGPEDWCRPLSIVSMGGGHSDYYSFKSCYGGTPENNAKWVKVKSVIGECWFGKTVNAFQTALHRPYEFVRGDIPEGHILDMGNYNSIDKR